MSVKKVALEQYVEQVTDGVEYKGWLKISSTQLEYRLVFKVPIPELDKAPLAEGLAVDEIRDIFRITVIKSGNPIQLSDKEYAFFFGLLIKFACEFCVNPQTRDSQQGIMGDMVRGNSPLHGLGASATIGVQGGGSFEFDDELCAMLSSPKFGCALV